MYSINSTDFLSELSHLRDDIDSKPATSLLLSLKVVRARMKILQRLRSIDHQVSASLALFETGDHSESLEALHPLTRRVLGDVKDFKSSIDSTQLNSDRIQQTLSGLLKKAYRFEKIVRYKLYDNKESAPASALTLAMSSHFNHSSEARSLWLYTFLSPFVLVLFSCFYKKGENKLLRKLFSWEYGVSRFLRSLIAIDPFLLSAAGYQDHTSFCLRKFFCGRIDLETKTFYVVISAGICGFSTENAAFNMVFFKNANFVLSF